MTKPIDLKVPAGAQLFNRLYNTRNPELLDEDLLTIRLQNGLCIDVGWYPQWDPSGFYEVRVFMGYGDADVTDPIQLADVFEVARTVERLCDHYNRPAVNFAESNNEIASAAA